MQKHTPRIGGVIHTYLKYDPKNFPSPTQPPPDLVSGAMHHLLYYGGQRELTEEELERAIHLDPSQIAGLGPSLEALLEMLRQRKAKILCTYDTDRVQAEAEQRFRQAAVRLHLPRAIQDHFERAVTEQQLYDLERLWYRLDREKHPAARKLLGVLAHLGNKYQVDELAARYEFTGRAALAIPAALQIKEELESIDRLLKQLEEAAKTAQIGIIDLEQLARRFLAAQDTLNRQVILITDGLPTAHFENQFLYLLYPPDRRTEEATLREGGLAARDGITINIFLLSTWSQSHEDIQFAHRLARTTSGRVFFTAGADLDRYVVWDYLNQKREVLG